MSSLGAVRVNHFGTSAEQFKSFINVETLSNSQSQTSKNFRNNDDSSNYSPDPKKLNDDDNLS